MPLAAALATLGQDPADAHGPVPAPEGTYDQGAGGWLCWEYEKRWHPGAADLPALLAPGRAHLQRLLEDGPAAS